MKQIYTKIESIKKIKPLIYLLEFSSPYLAKKAKPGQFLHLKIENKVTILRRPFSIHSIKGNKVYILFKVRGRGTKLLSQFKKGDCLDIIGPLGKGFRYEGRGRRDEGRILIAGGIGVAPLVFLAEQLKKLQITNYKLQNLVILGAKSKNEIVCEDEFKKLGYKVIVATEDGLRGSKGAAIDLLRKSIYDIRNTIYTDLYACGPKEMFFEINKIIKEYPQINCQVSFEQFMGCGLGICYGCSIETKNGYKKVCKDGPVFDIKDIY